VWWSHGRGGLLCAERRFQDVARGPLRLGATECAVPHTCASDCCRARIASSQITGDKEEKKEAAKAPAAPKTKAKASDKKAEPAAKKAKKK